MSIAAADVRAIKKAVCDLLGAVTGVGEVIPTRMTFGSKADYWAMVSPKKTQKGTETAGVACAMVYLQNPGRKIDPQNEQIFHMDLAVRLFREGFPERVDETSSPDGFRKKILLSEETFDAAAVNVGRAFGAETTVSGLSAGLAATILPMDTTDGQISYGPSDFLAGVEGHGIDLVVTVEVVHDDC